MLQYLVVKGEALVHQVSLDGVEIGEMRGAEKMEVKRLC